jgi:hypothetical protein
VYKDVLPEVNRYFAKINAWIIWIVMRSVLVVMAVLMYSMTGLGAAKAHTHGGMIA